MAALPFFPYQVEQGLMQPIECIKPGVGPWPLASMPREDFGIFLISGPSECRVTINYEICFKILQWR
jgi:hypothetical protein